MALVKISLKLDTFQVFKAGKQGKDVVLWMIEVLRSTDGGQSATAGSSWPSGWRTEDRVSSGGHLWRWDPGVPGGLRQRAGGNLPALPPCGVGADVSPVLVRFLVALVSAALRPFWSGGQLLDCGALAPRHSSWSGLCFPWGRGGVQEDWSSVGGEVFWACSP